MLVWLPDASPSWHYGQYSFTGSMDADLEASYITGCANFGQLTPSAHSRFAASQVRTLRPSMSQGLQTLSSSLRL